MLSIGFWKEFPQEGISEEAEKDDIHESSVFLKGCVVSDGQVGVDQRGSKIECTSLSSQGDVQHSWSDVPRDIDSGASWRRRQSQIKMSDQTLLWSIAVTGFILKQCQLSSHQGLSLSTVLV